MRAISITEFGGPDVLKLVERPTPRPAKGEVLVRVHGTAVNRADLLQRAGKYPPPPGVEADIPGLEFAGEITELGEDVHDWKVGDRVFGLASGATYAEFLCAPSRGVARISENLSYAEAASIPEAFITAYDAMVIQCGLAAGETVLITAVGSGVGTAAVQIARAIGATSIGAARTLDKLEAAKKLGMAHGISSESGTFAQSVIDATAGRGVDVIVELVGGSYVAEDLKCAAPKARIIVVGLVGGAKSDFDLGLLLRKRLTVRGTTLRMRPLEEKLQAAQVLARHLVPLFADGRLQPVIDRKFRLEEAAAAHAYVEENKNFGKVVLEA
jgi:NADPH2:quinone reductase